MLPLLHLSKVYHWHLFYKRTKYRAKWQFVQYIVLYLRGTDFCLHSICPRFSIVYYTFYGVFGNFIVPFCSWACFRIVRRSSLIYHCSVFKCFWKKSTRAFFTLLGKLFKICVFDYYLIIVTIWSIATVFFLI